MQDTEGAVIAQLLITYEWSDWRAADIWWMQSVYVAAPYRRQGLFTELYKHAKAESEKAGACGLRLYADDNNTKAHKTVSFSPSHLLRTASQGAKQLVVHAV